MLPSVVYLMVVPLMADDNVTDCGVLYVAAAIDGVGVANFKLMVCVPVRFAATALQLASVSETNVYVVAVAGATDTEIGLVFPENGVPSDNVPLHGAVPVTAISIVEKVPPVIFPEGNGFVPTVVFPVAVHPFKSVTVSVYNAALRPVILAEVPIVVAPCFQAYVYDPEPPLVIETDAVPLLVAVHADVDDVAITKLHGDKQLAVG